MGGMVESPHIMRGDFILMEGEGGQHVHPPSPPVVIALPGGLLGVGEVTMRCVCGGGGVNFQLGQRPPAAHRAK